MKQVFLSSTLCLLALFFLKTEGHAQSLALVETPTDISVMPRDTVNFQEYCGIYKMQGNPYLDEVKVGIKDGQLMTKTPDDEDIFFNHTENDAFYIAPFSVTAVFTRVNGIIKGVKVLVKGKEIVGDKL